MEIVNKSTKKGLVIRYIFEDVEEYEMYLNDIRKIAERAMKKNKEILEELISLFEDYYNPKSPYAEGKPTVTVFEDHILTLACLIWPLIFKI